MTASSLAQASEREGSIRLRPSRKCQVCMLQLQYSSHGASAVHTVYNILASGNIVANAPLHVPSR